MVKLFFCGDILNRFSENQFIEASLQDIIKSADISVANFEGVIQVKGAPLKGAMQRTNTVKFLKEAGFDLLLLSNNHITDCGLEGLVRTISAIDSSHLDHIGAAEGYEEAYKPYIKDINGVKIGFINLCEAQIGHYKDRNQSFGYAWIGDKNCDERIVKLRKETDVLIVLPHAGLELYSLPLQEFRVLYRHYCDLGADLVIGGHPHVPQGIESYNGKHIIYSLGNFYFPKPDIDNDDPRNSSYSIIVTIDGRSIEISPIYTKMNGMMVEVSPEPSFNIEELSEKLGCNYGSLVCEQNLEAFNSLVYNLYKEAVNGIQNSDSLRKKCSAIMQSFLPQSKTNEVHSFKLLRRLIENETYRYLSINALNHLIETYESD